MDRYISTVSDEWIHGSMNGYNKFSHMLVDILFSCSMSIKYLLHMSRSSEPFIYVYVCLLV